MSEGSQNSPKKRKVMEFLAQENISQMNALEGFNVIIVCCSSELQANYWQKRLDDGKGSVIAPDTIVLAVNEDWPGGAGNGLGTLYAYTKARNIAKDTLSLDIDEKMRSGEFSVGLFHTAGKGTRLAPLPGAENNNKPGVKLPATVSIRGESLPITILESVIKQTGCYAKSRPGRLSVFWGDQVFIPSVPVAYEVSFHADILCSLGPMPSEVEWIEKGMDKYGLIALSETGAAAQVEKVDHATAVMLLDGLGEIKSVGASLGSFSISSAMLFLLLDEFSSEIDSKVGKLDTDPHFWMPMTLAKTAYLHLMSQKKIPEAFASSHFDRIAAMMEKFSSVEGNASLGVFGPVDVGQSVYWWDYGQLPLYQKNTLLMIESSQEAELMRMFFGIGSDLIRDSTIVNTTVLEQSCVSSSVLGNEDASCAGSISKSIISNVRCNRIEANGAILINVTARSIVAKPGCIVYNVVDNTEAGLVLEDGQVLTGVFQSDGQQTIMKSSLSIDGGKAWEVSVEGNAHSFEQIYNINATVCPTTLEGVIASAHNTTWDAIKLA